MKADPRFLQQPKEFWANVRIIGQEVGYSEGREATVKTPSLAEIRMAFAAINLTTAHIAGTDSALTGFGQSLFDYFGFRAAVLNGTVRHNLMDKDAAQSEFKRLKKLLKPKCLLPLNKQRGAKRNFAFLTCIVNMLIEAHIGDAPCDFDPRSLTTVTSDAMPLRTLARRVDGAFPAAANPIAIWEIKEYYYTTTFGSRVADGVYETLLDGMELEELANSTGRKIQHVLFIDDHNTWWNMGRSYLCRMVDMLHMAYVDEIVFGREVLTRIPQMAAEWQSVYDASSYPLLRA